MRTELHTYGIVSEVNGDDTAACVSVQAGLVVWVRPGAGFSWWGGEWSVRGRKRYAWGPPGDPVAVARRVALRFAEAYAEHAHAALITDLLRGVGGDREVPPLVQPADRVVLVWPV
ncbi:hypothetical protein ABGB17_28995 [Sphaerisporangium sp. B11E5]|uniref:hypothetical protein n=1 Tax=Sphaerisporangium sp. B11E5 TaxID=3153563 RepID=UPI00325E056F